MSRPPSVIVAGAIAQRPDHGGHAWVFLQYLLGFRSLGWEVLFLDWIDPADCRDDHGRPCPPESSTNVRYLSGIMDRFGLSRDWAILHGEEGSTGLGRAEILKRAGRSTLLLNVMGYLDDERILDAVDLRVFVDIDPGFGQIWQETGLAHMFDGHDRHVTIGGHVGEPGCEIPTCGIDWIGVRPPVQLDRWPAAPRTNSRFTSVMSWRGPFGPLEYRGRTYGLRVHEFRRFLELPERTGAEFELALNIDEEAERDDVRRLIEHGWHLIDPTRAVPTPDDYRSYVQGSGAELMVAKGSTWTSEAAGSATAAPAIWPPAARSLPRTRASRDSLPLGEGLLVFSTLEEAADGAERIVADYPAHANAARRSPRCTSRPSGSSRACWRSWGSDGGRRRGRAREQTGERRRGLGADELGRRPPRSRDPRPGSSRTWRGRRPATTTASPGSETSPSTSRSLIAPC